MRVDPGNDRSLSLTSVHGKVMEKIILAAIEMPRFSMPSSPQTLLVRLTFRDPRPLR